YGTHSSISWYWFSAKIAIRLPFRFIESSFARRDSGCMPSPHTNYTPASMARRGVDALALAIGRRARAPRLARVAFSLAAQEVFQLLHELPGVELALGQGLGLLLACRRVVLLLQLPHVIPGRAVTGHCLIALHAEVVDGLREVRHVEAQVEQPGHVAHQHLDRGRILG